MATRKDASEGEEKQDAKCVNCGEKATLLTDGKSAERVAFCDRHTPANLRK